MKLQADHALTSAIGLSFEDYLRRTAEDIVMIVMKKLIDEDMLNDLFVFLLKRHLLAHVHD